MIWMVNKILVKIVNGKDGMAEIRVLEAEGDGAIRAIKIDYRHPMDEDAGQYCKHYVSNSIDEGHDRCRNNHRACAGKYCKDYEPKMTDEAMEPLPRGNRLDEECEECRRGIHRHMGAMKEPWFNASPRHQRIDAIDCKNPVGEGQCICHLYRAFMKGG